MSEVVDKILCTDGCNNNTAEMMALMNNANNWNNNPFMMLVFLAFLGNGGFGWGNNRGDWQGNANLSRQLQDLQGTVTDNHNNDIALQAINGNRDAIGQLAQTLNTSVQNVQTAICSVKSAIEQVGGQVGYSAEAVKNAIALGDANIIQQMQNCCCQQKELIQRMGYENQLATERQTNVLGSKIDAFAAQNALSNCQQTNALERAIEGNRQSIVSGFSQIGYQMAADKNEIMQNTNAGIQRIADIMCQNTTQQLRDQLAQRERELQTANIINQLKKECNCGC